MTYTIFDISKNIEVIRIEEVIDPVCGMKLSPEKAKAKYLYKGKVYYFCCEHCLAKFKEDLEKYIK